MSTLSVTTTKMTIGAFDSDNRYFREPVDAGDAEFVSPVGTTTAVGIISGGLLDGYTNWSFKIGSYTIAWERAAPTNTSVNIAV